MKKGILILILLVTSICGLKAQGYDNSIGLRGGYSAGIFYRYYMNSANSIRVLLSTRDEGLQVTLLREYYQALPNNFSFVYGFGGHLGYTGWNDYSNGNRDNQQRAVVGVDGLVGLDYNFREVPLSIGIEAKPFIDFGGEHDFYAMPLDFALTFRVNF